jgi:GPI-anchor transamidase subunit K
MQDSRELPYQDLSDALTEMKAKGRFREALLVLDTCQAESAGTVLTTPGVAMVGSSRTGESSYSTDVDPAVRFVLECNVCPS